MYQNTYLTERYAFTMRRHSNFSVAINKGFSITTRTSVIANTSVLSWPSSLQLLSLCRTLTTTELLLCNVINVKRLGNKTRSRICEKDEKDREYKGKMEWEMETKWQ